MGGGEQSGFVAALSGWVVFKVGVARREFVILAVRYCQKWMLGLVWICGWNLPTLVSSRQLCRIIAVGVESSRAELHFIP